MEAIRLNRPFTSAMQNEWLKSLYWFGERVGRLWLQDDDPQTLYLKATSEAVAPELRETIQIVAEEQAQFLRMFPTKIAFKSDRPFPTLRGDVDSQLIERWPQAWQAMLEQARSKPSSALEPVA